jgi:alkylation response protein AidB-like acyl-CoA dehydrogenase
MTAPGVWLRVAQLEQRLGDPWDDDNDVGFGAVLAADEARTMLGAGERLLDDFGLGAEYVPVALGGRLSRLDETMHVLRSVFARDPCLGLGHGVSSLIAAVNVWTSGNDAQRSFTSQLLRRGGRLAAAFHELAHGNDLGRSAFRAGPTNEGRLLLSGRKEVIANIERCDAFVLAARTSDAPGGRSHSQLLIDKRELSPRHFVDLPRFEAVGMRGLPLGGIEFCDCPVDASCILGETGRGFETALRAYQVTRIVLPGAFLGALDTALRITLRYLMDRRLYGSTAAALPQVQAQLVNVFVDLLRADAFTTVAVRALHWLPTEASLTAPAVKQLVPKLLIDAMETLATLLGAAFYVRRGPASMVQKLLRDLQPIAFGHVGRAACQTSLLPQIGALARRGARGSPSPAREIFSLTEHLPNLRFDALVALGMGGESVTPILDEAMERVSGRRGQGARDLLESIVQVRRELSDLLLRAKALPTSELGITASSDNFELAARYCGLLGASACIGVWSEAERAGTPFLSEPVWVAAAVGRALARTPGVLAPLPADRGQSLFHELTLRYREHRSFDLTRRKKSDL